MRWILAKDRGSVGSLSGGCSGSKAETLAPPSAFSTGTYRHIGVEAELPQRPEHRLAPLARTVHSGKNLLEHLQVESNQDVRHTCGGH